MNNKIRPKSLNGRGICILVVAPRSGVECVVNGVGSAVNSPLDAFAVQIGNWSL